MDTLSSSAPSKRHSPPKGYFIDELQEVKTISAQQDEELRQMEARLQILEVKHMEKRLAKLELKHERSSHSIHGRHHSSRRSSEDSSNAHGHGEDYRRRRHHHHSHGESYNCDQRHHQAFKPQVSFVKVHIFNGDSDPNVYLDWEAKCEQIFNAYEVEDQKVTLAALEFVDYAMKWWHTYVTDLAGDSNVEGFAMSNSVFRKNAPSTPQELQVNLRNTTNGASSGRLHSDAQVNLCKTTKELQN